MTVTPRPDAVGWKHSSGVGRVGSLIRHNDTSTVHNNPSVRHPGAPPIRQMSSDWLHLTNSSWWTRNLMPWKDSSMFWKTASWSCWRTWRHTCSTCRASCPAAQRTLTWTWTEKRHRSGTRRSRRHSNSGSSQRL
ncbi:TIMELESS-interacting protein [Sarotherodon galilaeus]